MTRRDSLQCIHEPFGDAFYYGPERLGSRYENDEQTRVSSGFSNSTFKTVLDGLDRESAEVRYALPSAASFDAKPCSPVHEPTRSPSLFSFA